MDRLHQAKAIDIVWFLSQHGHSPVRETARTASYLSPFRSESSPSFSVNKVLNRYTDFGEDIKSHDVLDLVQRMDLCTLQEAITTLLDDGHIKQYHKPDIKIDETNNLEIVSVEDNITCEPIVDYICNVRGIPIDVVDHYCQQVSILFASSPWATHRCIGVENDLGGYALRNSWFRGTSRPAGITTVVTGESLECLLFEGFIDWLSYVVMYGEPEHTSIILNSVVFIPMIIDYLQGCDVVHAWVDNDAAASTKVEHMIANEVNVVDHRVEFADYNDLNDKLMAESSY